VDDVELKYGLSVTGTVHPAKVLTKGGAKPGDQLVLTKPIGTGIINTAVKGGMAGERAAETVARSMSTLNKAASEVMLEVGVNACTDITGFGLLGHACEMIQDGQIGLKIRSVSVPIFPETIALARMGMIPGGTYRNKDFRSGMVDLLAGVGDVMLDILFDPQTSGGLLISVGADKTGLLLTGLKEAGVPDAAVIGDVVSRPARRIVVE
jgi:selenide,water dikinase